MIEPQDSSKPTQVSGPVSVSPRPEGPPVDISGVDTESSGVNIEHGPDFAPPPKLDESVGEVGVVSHSTQAIPKEASDAGLIPSVPESLYAVDSTLPQAQVEREIKDGDVKTSSPWRALLDFIKRLREGNRQNKEQPQEA